MIIKIIIFFVFIGLAFLGGFIVGKFRDIKNFFQGIFGEKGR